MRSILTIGWLVLMTGTALVEPSTARAQDSPDVQGGLGGWSPFSGVELAIHAQEVSAEGATTFGAVGAGTNTLSNLNARMEAGIKSPSIEAIPGQPRIVMRGGVSLPLRETSTIMSDQTIGDDVELGTDLSMSWKMMWHAGLDLQYRLPLEDYLILVHPGIEYLGSRFRYETKFIFRAQPVSDLAQQTPNPFNPPRVPFEGRSSPDVHHFIGPTLSIEAGLVGVGPATISAFLGGRMYFLVGDRDTSIEFDKDLLGTAQTGTGRLESNFIAGQVAFGIRGSF
jgi:hypothetical protein